MTTQENEAPNPYVTLREQPGTINAEGQAADPDDNAVVTDSAPKDRQKRLLIAAACLIGVAAIIGGLYLRFGRTITITQEVKAKPQTPAKEQATDQQPMVDSAIEKAKESLRKANEQESAGGQSGPVDPGRLPEGAASVPPRVVLPSFEDLGTGRNEKPSGNGPGSTATPHGISANPQNQAQEPRRGQLKYSTASMYIAEAQKPQPVISKPPAPLTRGFNRSATVALKPVPVPVFGTMLPIRTLGSIYTLRNSYARLELTQDIAGDGWQLKKGTVFVAQTQNGVMDRAYLNVAGFIDPEANRFVKVTGDVLGDDAGAGLKGKRRQFTGRWTRAFNRVMAIAPGLAQAALARNGGTTVIVPVGGELLGSQSQAADRREFVEVDADARGYILITDLPDSLKGVDADPTVHLANSADQKTVGKELTDAELAELLVNGSTKEIRDAMPRMTLELRRIAALAIGEKGDR
ncbi:MAG TPA: hypothetical protein VJ302_36915 [Blastocatellia bacterium]|nr:hypothetical protein [Blastocatellia bacterium]